MQEVKTIENHFGRPKEYTEQVAIKLGDDLVAYMRDPKNYWLKGFAIDNNIPAERLSRLAEDNEYFRQAYKLAKDIQEQKLAENGLKGKFNAQMTKFTLMNVSGWREQGSTDLTTGGNPLGYVALPNTIDIESVEEAEIID